MSDDKIEHYKAGMNHFAQRRFAEAVTEYEKALERSPDWTEALHGLAMAQMHLGKLDEAIATGKRIVELDPNDPFAYTSLSMFYQRKGDIEEAEKQQAKARMASWKQELKTNPDAPPPSGADGISVVQ